MGASRASRRLCDTLNHAGCRSYLEPTGPGGLGDCLIVGCRLSSLRSAGGIFTLLLMGLVQALDYKLPVPSAVQRAMWRISSSRPGAWLFARSLPRVDKFVLRMSRGQVTLAGITGGIPVLTITTTGARSDLRRTTPLLGVPFGGDIAIIGTNFGQLGTPGWYYNLRAQPRAEVTYRNRSVTATAREADAEERQTILGQARKIYSGYEAYARRITDRQIPIMILTG
jgi:deazaflavin-dependent oxidoreductase (nitroreductase family)